MMPSDLVQSKNSEDVLILAESRTHASLLGLELSHASSREVMRLELLVTSGAHYSVQIKVWV